MRIDQRKLSGRLVEAAALTDAAVQRYLEVLESPSQRASLLRKRSHAESLRAQYEASKRSLHEATELLETSSEADLALQLETDLSQLLFARGDVPAAVALARDLVDRKLSIFGSRHPQTLNARGHLAFFLRTEGRPEEALEVLDRLETDLRRSMGDDHRRLLTRR